MYRDLLTDTLFASKFFPSGGYKVIRVFLSPTFFKRVKLLTRLHRASFKIIEFPFTHIIHHS